MPGEGRPVAVVTAPRQADEAGKGQAGDQAGQEGGEGMTEAIGTVAERVARGAALLDGKDPGWWREDADRAIDLDTLRLASCRLCVLGQWCPLEDAGNPFWESALLLSGADPGDQSQAAEDLVASWAAGHGFSAWGLRLNDDSGFTVSRDLTAEWSRVIRERRAAA